MKKYLYSILAVAAVLSACAKVDQVEKTVEPKDVEKASFYGTIEQPEGLTRTYILEENDAAVSINWSAGDVISVYGKAKDSKNFVADQDGANVYFGSSDPDAGDFLKDNDGAGYEAYYPVWAKSGNWFDRGQINLSCKSSDTDKNGNNINQASLEYMPMYASLGPVSNPSHTYRQLQFSCAYHAILKLTIPESFACSKMDVIDNDKSQVLAEIFNINELGAVNGVKTIYVPIPVVDHAETYSRGFTFNAYNGSTSVATMFTFEGEDKTSGTVTTICGITVEYNTIYAFDYCNTLTINNPGEYELTKNGLDYRINVSADIAGTVTFKYEEGEGVAPANIYINARGHEVSELTVNAPESHVEIDYGQSVNVTSKTSLNTFVVKEHYAINELTVSKGSVVVEGKEDKTANVSTVTIPEGVTEQIIIDVTGVSAEGNDRVEIVNNSAQKNVSVVIEKDDNPDGGESKEYYVTQNQVTPVVKDVVATIGKTGYATIAEAVTAVKNGETITVIKDVVLESPIETDKTFTLTVNANISPVEGWKYDATKDALLIVRRGGNITINGTGKISSNGVENVYSAVKMTNKGEDAVGDAAKLTVNGNVTLEGYYYGICGNGSRQNTEVTINGGTIKGTATDDNAGIYNPQAGKLTINGGTIEGATGIYVKSGDVTTAVNAGTIKGVGSTECKKYNPDNKADGCDATGDALVIDNCNYPGGVPTVKILGGSFVSENHEAVMSYARTGYEPVKGFISGGTFSSDPWKYCAKGYASIKEGQEWVVIPAPKAEVIKVHPVDSPSHSVDDNGRMILADGDNGVYAIDQIIDGEPYATIDAIDVCYTFKAMEEDGTDGEFDKWLADFVISVDRDITTSNLGLWGKYPLVGARAFTAPYEIPANTEIPLLGAMETSGVSSFTYGMVQSLVQEFTCGAFKLDESIEGATLKVDLRIFDPNNTYKYFVIESYDYKFTNKTDAQITMLGQGVAKIGNTYYETLEEAVNAATATDVIELFEGEYTTYNTNFAKNKTLIFEGVDGKTIWKYGSSSTGVGEAGADGSLHGSNVTFKKITLADNGTANDYYRGFTYATALTFENCTFKNMIGYLGTGDVHFNNCVFDVASVCEYAVKTYSGAKFYFDGCTFKGNNKANIQLYRENTTNEYYVQVKDCKFYRGSDKSKTAVYFYDPGSAGGAYWEIHLDGNNENLGEIAVDSVSGSWLCGTMKQSTTGSKTKIFVGEKLVWANGAKQN